VVSSLVMSGSAFGAYAPSRASTPALFGRVMGLVALTVGFATLGVWLGRDSGGAAWFIAWLLAIGCLIGLNLANRRGHTSLAVILLFAFGLLLGWSVATTVNFYAQTDPTALRQAFGATALSVAALGAGGYAVRRDLSFLYRILFWLLLALIAAGIVLIFVRIPAAYTIWSVLGLLIFAGYTVVDFNRLRRAGKDEAIPLAASIFLDVFNIFLFFLQLFAGRS
jgi:FtsH-binding integral membrane protein